MINCRIRGLQSACFLGLILSGLHPFEVFADLLIFENGDRLSGQFREQTDGRLLFESAVLGLIWVEASEVELIRETASSSLPVSPIASTPPNESDASDSPDAPPPLMKAVANNAPTDPNTAATEASAPAKTIAGATPPTPPSPEKSPPQAKAPAKTAPVENLANDNDEPDDGFLMSPEMRALMFENQIIRGLRSFWPLQDWKNRISAGASWLSGERDQVDLNFNFSSEKITSKSEYRLRAKYEYRNQRTSTKDWAPTKDRLDSSFRFRRDIGQSFFFQANTAYLQDDIRLIDSEIEQSIGTGWRFLDKSKFKGTITPSGTARYRDISGQDGEWFFLVTLFQDFKWDFTKRNRLIQEAAVSFEPNNPGQSSYSFNFRIENQLTERLTINFAYAYSFDYNVGVGVERAEQRASTTLGLEF